MEFGALQCKPKSPDCVACPLQMGCYAFNNKVVDVLPVKIKKGKSRNRYFNYFIVQKEDKVIVNKRGSGDIWQHLHDFPLLESASELGPDELGVHDFVVETFGPHLKFRYRSREYKHILSHQNIFARFFVLQEAHAVLNENHSWNYVLIKDLDKLAKPKLIVSFLEEYTL